MRHLLEIMAILKDENLITSLTYNLLQGWRDRGSLEAGAPQKNSLSLPPAGI